MESYKEPSASTLPANISSGKHQATSISAAPPATQNWNSIFPNENYEFMLGDWEKKIILDVKV